MTSIRKVSNQALAANFNLQALQKLNGHDHKFRQKNLVHIHRQTPLEAGNEHTVLARLLNVDFREDGLVE